jgi:hypothetical protein
LGNLPPTHTVGAHLQDASRRGAPGVIWPPASAV